MGPSKATWKRPPLLVKRGENFPGLFSSAWEEEKKKNSLQMLYYSDPGV